MMATRLESFAALVRQLRRAVEELQPLATRLEVPSPVQHEWHGLLVNKLLAQLELPPLLVVAIIGGTNIGKSVIFNHLAGEVASAVSPLAAHTKHPVCLVPPGLADPQLLARLFEGFSLRPWSSPDDAKQPCDEHLLFWRIGAEMPPRLLLIDAPDVDSDVTVNWQRARAIRQCADVLLAVLTQQKYNDAAVKQFFREAAQSDKAIIVLFNQVHLPDDEPYWPTWLDTFCQSTGADPELVYLVPFHRVAAERLCLPFYLVKRAMRPEVGGGTDTGVTSAGGFRASGAGQMPAPISPAAQEKPQARNLREELAKIHFEQIKLRAFRGALRRVFDAQRGAPAYRDSIRQAAQGFAEAAQALSTTLDVRWPALPAAVLVDEFRLWWDDRRSQWSRAVHGVYRRLGRAVVWPVSAALQRLRSRQEDQLAAFRRKESEAILAAVKARLDELSRLSEVGNDLLRPRLRRLLGGTQRERLLEQVADAYRQLPAVDEDYRQFLRGELDAWWKSNPGVVRFLRSLDNAAAVARPVITITLLFTGLQFAGKVVGDAALQLATQSAAHLATEAAIAGGTAAGGEVVAATTGEGIAQTAARLFSRLQYKYAQQRGKWLVDWLERELMGPLLDELRTAAAAPDSPPFAALCNTIERLRQLL